jgi:hypothetical protein
VGQIAGTVHQYHRVLFVAAIGYHVYSMMCTEPASTAASGPARLPHHGGKDHESNHVHRYYDQDQDDQRDSRDHRSTPEPLRSVCFGGVDLVHGGWNTRRCS